MTAPSRGPTEGSKIFPQRPPIDAKALKRGFQVTLLVLTLLACVGLLMAALYYRGNIASLITQKALPWIQTNPLTAGITAGFVVGSVSLLALGLLGLSCSARSKQHAYQKKLKKS